MSRRGVAFAILVVVCTAVPLVYLLRVRHADHAEVPTPQASAPPAAGSLLPAVPVVYRFTGSGDLNGRLVRGALGAASSADGATALRCERLDLAAGHGVCLAARRGVFTTYEAILFDAEFRPRHTLALSGVPSRTRVSPDGRLAAITVFESGHSYAADAYSTRTSILDLERGDMKVDDLERFSVLRDGELIDSADFNFWGVTFVPDGKRFYATLATGGRSYLVEGDLDARQLRVLRPDVECPALSPDGKRIAYKRRQADRVGPVAWQLSVLRLDTLEDWPLSETRSVDDQPAWLDDRTVLYALPAAASGTPAMHTWAVSADGGGTPQLAMRDASSLGVVR